MEIQLSKDVVDGLKYLCTDINNDKTKKLIINALKCVLPNLGN